MREAGSRLAGMASKPKTLYLATSNEPEIVADTKSLAQTLSRQAPRSLTWHYEPMPQETHGTIYHPAALKAFRMAFKPQPPASPASH